jgi:uncharacterized protein (DUF1015 family)
MVVPSSSETSPPAPATGLEVRPFRALTYRRRDPGHLARVSSPAYDLVTASGRDRLAGADPHNIVRLILPRLEPAPGGAGNGAGGDPVLRSAEQAAGTLAAWLRDGVLDRDEEPALWLYEMSPPHGAPSTVGWLGAVALPAAGSAAVLPHEDTYPVAVEGRRALLAATATDLEPIVLAHDPDPDVGALTTSAARGEPTLEVTDDDGVRHRLRRVTDEAVLTPLREAFARTGAVIADGHHRFAAARANARSQPSVPGLVHGRAGQPTHRLSVGCRSGRSGRQRRHRGVCSVFLPSSRELRTHRLGRRVDRAPPRHRPSATRGSVRGGVAVHTRRTL